MPEHLFVYGTLMSGMASGGILSSFHHAPATARGQLYRSPAGGPVLVPDEAGREIVGELIRLPDPAALLVLDLLEGVKHGRHHRQRLRARSGGAQVEAWAWVLSLQAVEARGFSPLPVSDWRSIAPKPSDP